MSISGQNLSVVIVTLRSEKVIDRCIKSINKNLPIIVVENSDNLKFTDKVPNNLKWPDENRVVKNGQLNIKNLDKTHWWNREKGGSFSFELPIIECILKKGLKMLGPRNYEQLVEKEKRRLTIGTSCILYFKYLNLINTQNETT